MMAPPLQRPKDAERRRKQLLNAAKEVIINDGLEAATLRNIAREAGVTTGMISHYFRDKSDIVVSCFETVSEDWLRTAKTTIAEAASTEQKLLALTQLCLPLSADDRKAWCIWTEMWTHAGRNADLTRTMLAVDSIWESMVFEILVEGKEAGLVDARVNVAREASILVRLADGLSLRSWQSNDWEKHRENLFYYMQKLCVGGGRL